MKSVILAVLGFLVATPALAKTTLNVTCEVSDERYIQSTGQNKIIIQNLLDDENEIANFPDASKFDETVVTKKWVTVAYSNQCDNMYTFALPREAADLAIHQGIATAVAEVRFINSGTGEFEDHLRDTMLKMNVECEILSINEAD